MKEISNENNELETLDIPSMSDEIEKKKPKTKKELETEAKVNEPPPEGVMHVIGKDWVRGVVGYMKRDKRHNYIIWVKIIFKNPRTGQYNTTLATRRMYPSIDEMRLEEYAFVKFKPEWIKKEQRYVPTQLICLSEHFNPIRHVLELLKSTVPKRVQRVSMTDFGGMLLAEYEKTVFTDGERTSLADERQVAAKLLSNTIRKTGMTVDSLSNDKDLNINFSK